jgi:hypothetical protein
VRIGVVRATLHLGGLWALAFAQPLLGLLGHQAEFFVARGSTPSDILVLAIGYGLLPPLVGGVAVWAAGLVHPLLGWGLYLGLVALLVAALALPPAADLLDGSAAAVVLALLVGAAVAVAVARRPEPGALLTALGPAPLVVVALFLVFSPVSELVRGGEASGSVGGPAHSQTPILHVILDELPVTTVVGRDGRIDARRFPNLARLARDATWYRHATTTADSTLEAVPLQLTGLEPHVGDLPTSADHPRNLFTLFSRSHHPIVAEPITDLCPSRLCAEPADRAAVRLRALASDLGIVIRHQLLPAALTRGLPPIDRTWSGFAPASDGPVSQASADRLRTSLGAAVGDDLRRRDDAGAVARITRALRAPHARPPLVFAHLTVPHAPWRFLPDGGRYVVHGRDPPGLSAKSWLPQQWQVDQAFQRHVLQAQYADTLLGRLLDAFRAAGLYDRAVIVVTSDHGASFTAGERRRSVTDGNVGEIAGVPFVVKLPGQRHGRVDDRAVRTVDVLPTIARAAGVRVPWDPDGRPAGERPVDPRARIAISHAGAPGSAPRLAAVLAAQRRRNAHETLVLASGTYAVGPRPDLLGRAAPTGRPSAEGPRATVAAGGGALVSGRLSRVATGTVLAIAVDGRVRATTRAYPEYDGWRYQALVPPGAVAGGRHAVTILTVGPGDRLRPIGGA